MSERRVLELRENQDDSIQFVANGKSLHVSASNDWAGDTETGFGLECGCTVNFEQGKELAEFLCRWIAENIGKGDGNE